MQLERIDEEIPILSLFPAYISGGEIPTAEIVLVFT